MGSVDVVANAVVAADGSGNFTTIVAAVEAAPRNSPTRHVIRIKAGVYREYVAIGKDISNLTLIGEGMHRTVISGNRSNKVVGGYKTNDSATISVDGPGFVAHDLTIENTAGASNQQAVALRSTSDQSAIYRCALNGYQDTLYAKRNRQFYCECHISGTVDFIFGDATAVFQKCILMVRKPIHKQQNTITAHGRENATETTGFVFQFCNVVADDDLVHAGFPVETYLGRPWKVYARVVFMQCDLQALVDPKGWLQWPGSTNVADMYYGEYRNSGAGANVSGRVNWPGFHVIGDASQAASFTVHNFIQGEEWLPATGAPFIPGLEPLSP